MRKIKYSTRSILAACGMLLLFSGCRSESDLTVTEADVLAISNKHQEAWNKMDVDAIIACYTADAIVADTDVPPFHWQNHAGIRQWLLDSFKSFKSAHVTQDMRQTRILGNIAISNSHFAFQMVTPDGKSALNQGWVTEVVKITPSGPKLAAFHASPIPKTALEMVP